MFKKCNVFLSYKHKETLHLLMNSRTYKYHYLYKITNNITSEYYYGVHSTDDINDGYFESGI